MASENKALPVPKEPRGHRKNKAGRGPTRAKSGYLFFGMEKRDALKKENPDAKIGELGRLLAEEWKVLTADEKKAYEESAAKDKLRYETEMAAWQKENPELAAALLTEKAARKGFRGRKAALTRRGNVAHIGSVSFDSGNCIIMCTGRTEKLAKLPLTAQKPMYEMHRQGITCRFVYACGKYWSGSLLSVPCPLCPAGYAASDTYLCDACMDEINAHPATSLCNDPDCIYCGYRDCPANCPMHYDKDGCPVCALKKIESKEVKEEPISETASATVSARPDEHIPLADKAIIRAMGKTAQRGIVAFNVENAMDFIQVDKFLSKLNYCVMGELRSIDQWQVGKEIVHSFYYNIEAP